VVVEADPDVFIKIGLGLHFVPLDIGTPLTLD